MAGRVEHLCPGCNFPARRGKLPIIWKSDVNDRQVFCGVLCLEKVAGGKLPEPMRTQHLLVEGK